MKITNHMGLWLLAERMGPDTSFEDAKLMRDALCETVFEDTEDIPEDTWNELMTQTLTRGDSL